MTRCSLIRSSDFFADPKRVHRINHVGKHFKVRGPLNVPRPLKDIPSLYRPDHPKMGNASQRRMPI